MAALAWLFVIAGCREGRWKPVLAGGVLAVLLALFKAQLAVAVVPPLAMWPWLFFRGLSRRVRVAGLLATFALLAVAPFAVAHIPSAPDLRPGRSGAGPYLAEVRAFQPDNAARKLLNHALATPSYPRKVVFGVPFLLIAPFCLLLAAYPALLVMARRRRAAGDTAMPSLLPEALLPMLTTVMFLMMSLLLPLSTTGFGGPDELLHRPFVWAYFVLAACGGGLFALLLPAGTAITPVTGVPLVSTSVSRPIADFQPGVVAGSVIAVAILLLVPLSQGRDIQRGPAALPVYVRIPVPTGLVESCRFVRGHSAPTDIVQDTHYNYFETVAALAERTPYFTDVPSDRGKASYEQIVAQRLPRLERLRRSPSVEALRASATETGIRWLIVYPGDTLGWPPAVVSRPAFSSGGFRVYRLD